MDPHPAGGCPQQRCSFRARRMCRLPFAGLLELNFDADVSFSTSPCSNPVCSWHNLRICSAVALNAIKNNFFLKSQETLRAQGVSISLNFGHVRRCTNSRRINSRHDFNLAA